MHRASRMLLTLAGLKQQLGLKPEAQRGPVEYFVIDHLEKPAEN
jgi:uncharacterized protein (TIGR03435 family)